MCVNMNKTETWIIRSSVENKSNLRHAGRRSNIQ